MPNALLSLLVTIVDRGKGEGVTELMDREGANHHTVTLGHGTAHKGILSVLGLKDTAKDVVFTFLPSHVAENALRRLSYALDIDRPGKGIAFVLPVGSVHAEFHTDFQTAGINQTRHRVTLMLTARVQLVIPSSARTVEAFSQLAVAESIIVGEVPDTFTDVGDDMDMLDLVP